MIPPINLKPIEDAPPSIKDGREVLGAHDINGEWSYCIIKFDPFFYFSEAGAWVNAEEGYTEDNVTHYCELPREVANDTPN
jgi:hypothetical protein